MAQRTTTARQVFEASCNVAREVKWFTTTICVLYLIWTALTLPGAFLTHFAILGFMYWPLHIRGVKLCLLSCTNTFWLFLMSVVQYMCRYGKIPGEGSVQHESMVLQLKGGIVRIFDLGSTGIILGLQTCFLLWVMRMAWSPKSDAIESTEAGKR